MKKGIIFFTLLAVFYSITSCGGKKSNDSTDTETITPQVYSPIDLYFMRPTAMAVNPGNEQNPMAYLPDFITYPNDLVKFGLKGNVKECVIAVSTLSWTYKFNTFGNLINYQFRMDSQGRFGEGVKLEYDNNNQLTLLGRDFRGQSPNSDSYIYSDGHLVKRQNGNRYRDYIWTKNNKGTDIPVKSVSYELKPMLDVEYTENADGMVLLSRMAYNNPHIPGAMTAKSGVSTFEYDSNGRVIKINTAYSGCSNVQYREMWGECTYSYNEVGNVSEEIVTLFDSDNENDRKQLYTVTQSYTYKYDEHENWISVTMTSSNPQPGTIPTMNRNLTYYSEEEMNSVDNPSDEVVEKIFAGEWEYRKTYEQESDGEIEMVIDEGRIVMNLYDKMKWEWSEEPILGYINSSSTPSLGMEQSGTFIIIKANLKETSANIVLEGFYSKDLYSATLDYDSDGKALLIENLKLIRRATHDPDEAGDDTFDLEPFEGMYFPANSPK